MRLQGEGISTHVCVCVHMWTFKRSRRRGAPCSTSEAHFSNTTHRLWVKFHPTLLTLTSCCFCGCGGGTGKLAWPIMAEQCRLSTAAHCAQIFALFAPPPSPPFASHTQPAGTEMAAPLTRFTIPPLVHATIEGHGHRHLCGTQEAEEGMLGPHRQVVLPASV